jgi:hypothetical protein
MKHRISRLFATFAAVLVGSLPGLASANWTPTRGGSTTGGINAPELDPTMVGTGLFLVVGIALVLHAARRRA